MKKIIYLLLIGSFFLYSCEEEFLPDVANAEPDIVVEGYITFGDNAFPPYVLLTKSLNFFSEINLQELDDFYISGADVTVDDGTNTTTLQEFCIADLTPEQITFLEMTLGINIGALGQNFCMYIDLTNSVDVKEGGVYNLEIKTDGKVVTSQTSIPFHVAIDSMFFADAIGDKNDTLAQMRVILSDPSSQIDFYRYKTQIPEEPFFPGRNSVFDDVLVNGQEFEFALERGQSTFAEFDRDTYGLFWRGDTVRLEWQSIDVAHFEFWESLEFNRQNQGPFSNYTLIKTNIKGGLGIWGGISSRITTVLVPEN